MIRNLTGVTGDARAEGGGFGENPSHATSFIGDIWQNSSSGGQTRRVKFDASMAVPTGPECGVRTLSVTYWRRIN